jgi:hypothetical protein
MVSVFVLYSSFAYPQAIAPEVPTNLPPEVPASLPGKDSLDIESPDKDISEPPFPSGENLEKKDDVKDIAPIPETPKLHNPVIPYKKEKVEMIDEVKSEIKQQEEAKNRMKQP